MSNLFTFDLQDQEQIHHTNQKQNAKFKQQQNQIKQRINAEPFLFDDFDQFQQEQEKKENKSTKKMQNKENIANIQNKDKKGKIKNKEKKTVASNTLLKKLKNNTRAKSSSSEDQNIQEQQTKTKKQLTSSIMPGLQVQNLGNNQMEYVCQKKALKVTDMRKFLHTPMGNYKIKALIKKQGGNIFNFNSKFNVFIQQNNRFIFSITRQGIFQYIFSLDSKNVSEKKKSYLGKMCANLSGTQFLMYDSGFSPKQTRSLQTCRKQIASIKYSSNSGPRKFQTIISKNSQGFYALQPQQNILQYKWNKKQRDFLSILYSKDPELDPEDGNYKLDFKGIVKKASVKNFVLGGTEFEDSLIFGKIDNQTYIMEIKQPLSVLQAAAICISSIHYKLHWK